MNSYRNNPDGEENQLATKQNDAEIFALQMMERTERNNMELTEELFDAMREVIRELRLENDILRKMNEATRQYNEQLLADRQEQQALPELKPITTELAPAPKPIAAFPEGRWQHL